MPYFSARGAGTADHSPLQWVLREAKRLHRFATSDSMADALPVLRRLLTNHALPAERLPALFRDRKKVQRKHVLRALACEAGHPSWEAYRQALDQAGAPMPMLALCAGRDAASLKLWFPSETEALRFATEHGGQAVCVGKHAVVLPASGLCEPQGGR